MARMRYATTLRGALSVVCLALGIVVGLLGMHAFNTHGSADPHTVVTHAAAAPASPALHHTAETNAEVAVPSDVGHGVAALCVLALLGGLLLLLRRPSLVLAHGPGRVHPLPAFGRTPRPRPPSLHVLCISRT